MDEDDLLLLQAPPKPNLLANRIIAAYTKSNFDKPPQEYLPATCIGRILTREVVGQELSKKIDDIGRTGVNVQKYDKTFQDQLTNWILEEASKVFVIAFQCQEEPIKLLLSLIIFRKEGFNNDSLPIGNPTDSPPLLIVFDSRIWSPFQIKNFHDNQWKCLVPIFSPKEYHYNLLSNYIFPFTKDGDTPKEGAFSAVHKVYVHSDHQEHVGLHTVAIKEITVSRGNDETKTDKAWEDEARALDIINTINHPNIVKCVAAIRRGSSRYFMFPWANGESLRDYWEKSPKQPPSEARIHQAIVQLRDLADALDKLHNFRGEISIQNEAQTPATYSVDAHAQNPTTRVHDEDDETSDYADIARKESIRHGDLKPENILIFSDQTTAATDPAEPSLGVLKIADMGLAKRHVIATQDRSHLTTTKYGTLRYEAPEAETELQGGRSRLYDIWSMGCITLEFIIWILYGNKQLTNFYEHLKAHSSQACQFFEIVPGGTGDARVHTVVRQWMDHIQKNDPECLQNSAIGDLMDVVRTKLLVVPLPPDRASNLKRGRRLVPPASGELITRYRATAADFRKALDAIIAKASQPRYLLTGKDRSNIRLPAPKSDFLSPHVAHQVNGTVAAKTSFTSNQQVTGVLPIRADYSLPPLKGWEFPVDERFADQVLAQIGSSAFSPSTSEPSQLCSRCSRLDLWIGGFAFEDHLADLEARMKDCDFCRMLHGACQNNESLQSDKIRFERIQSTLKVSGIDGLPAFSIFRGPALKLPFHVQLGLPELLPPGTDSFFSIIKLWLEDCNANHPGCQGTVQQCIPTRLIDVGTLNDPQLRLVETREETLSTSEYIALSHPWGDPEKFPPFSTLRKDPRGKGREIEKFRKSIPYDQLPATFQHAVDTTRALKIRYLWIDSLCIIQGKDGDFSEEAKRMEDVFSRAYCVLAATRATNQYDGFLGSRPQTEYATFKRGSEEPFYVCKSIDNFSQDVIESTLNRRGWVLQERALARRTIFFTKNQTYFECGSGVRCETLAKMHNSMADFLGDPHFPDKAMRTNSRAEKISYFQDLYQQYSRFGFTRYEDRPFAVAGLESRLQKAFGTKGGFGIFDDGADGGLFHRSLLWQRGKDEPMSSIVFPPDRNIKVPSWSWMAYKGGIDYTDPPFQTAEWEREEIHPPWSRGGKHDTESAPTDAGLAITAIVRDFDVAGRGQGEVGIVYDVERTASDGQRPQCVIVARSRTERVAREKRYYVLLVAATHAITDRGEKIYKRIGAGFMMGKHITLDTPGIAAKIY